jgi:hypothetical protein
MVMDGIGMSRRHLLGLGAAWAGGVLLPSAKPRARHLIFLRMDGGPSQFDTWAPEPGGSFRSISTAVPGLRYCEHMPELAQVARHICVLSDLASPEINHRRAHHFIRHGVQLPPTCYPAAEPRPARQGPFADQCRRALRLVMNGAPYAEAVLPGWDTHTDNAPRVRRLLAEMDPAMASLIRELEANGLLGVTLVMWMGEFGRTRALNRAGGRDHDSQHTCVALAGASVRGGIRIRGYGRTLGDVLATVSAMLPETVVPRSYRLAGTPIRAALGNATEPVRSS